MYSLSIKQFNEVEQTVRLEVKQEGLGVFTCTDSGGFIERRIPSDEIAFWSEASYLTMEIEHHCHDDLVILLEFISNLEAGENGRIEAHLGVLPEVPTLLCFPLEALKSDRLFLDRYPNVLQMVLRGGTGIAKDELKMMRIGTTPSISPRAFYIRNITLSKDLPEFKRKTIALIDELGQYNRKNWVGKTIGEDELITYLQQELKRDRIIPESKKKRSSFGGWLEKQFKATGYFRKEHDGNRWWLVDPEGCAFLSVGLDCIIPSEPMRVDGMNHLTTWLPERTGVYASAWSGNEGERNFYYGISNLIRAFGSDWRASWAAITEKRLCEWDFNTVANWSDPDFIQFANKPYVWPLEHYPSTKKLIFRDFPDVFSEEFQTASYKFAEQLIPLRDDSLLIGYFLRNEPQWAFVNDLNITEIMLEQSEALDSKLAFISFIKDRYNNEINDFNNAWTTYLTDFNELLIPIPKAASLSEQAKQDLKAFNLIMIERYVKLPSLACRNVDPNHLNLGMRYAWISSDELLAGAEYYDVFSLNTYEMKPDQELIDRVAKATNLPVIIGEFHHGATDVGMLATGIRGVRTQRDRGLAYRYFVENGFASSYLIGTHYFVLNDQALLGRFDGENYQIGAVDVCHRPYSEFINEVCKAHEVMYEVANGQRSPYSEEPMEVPRTGF
jgi:hypothetical protein